MGKSLPGPNPQIRPGMAEIASLLGPGRAWGFHRSCPDWQAEVWTTSATIRVPK